MADSRLTRILLVDDEDSFRLSMEIALKMTNSFSVQSCDSGEAAQEILKTSVFDVVILDNKMGGISGIEVLQWMHSEGILTPTIMVTAVGPENVAIEAMKLGAYDYLRKDQLDIDRLRLAIISVCERYQYRVETVQRDTEKRLFAEKQKELESLRLYQNTMNSVGQLLERNLVEFQKNLARCEQEFSESFDADARTRFSRAFHELHKTVEVIVAGVSSVRDLSSVVTHRLEEINLVVKE